MSVTFEPTPGPIDHHIVECLNCGATQRFADSGPAFDLVRAGDEGTGFLNDCTDKSPYGCGGSAITYGVESVGVPPQVNISNDNARLILSLLGVVHDGEDLFGALPASDLLGRALIALAVAPVDEGVPAHEVPGPGARLVNCGRHPGYSEDRLRAIAEVAQWAITHDREVQWG